MFPFFSLMYFRLETERIGSHAEKFMPVFNKAGQDVWDGWDEFLKKRIDGMSFLHDNFSKISSHIRTRGC